jgi:uncharacterized protein (TIGR02001 family)
VEHRTRVFLITAFWCVGALTATNARSQSSVVESSSTSSTVGIDLGSRGLIAGGNAGASKDEDRLQFSAKAGIASDYMYRGVTLSDHKPAVGAAIEATFAQFYAAVSAAKVRLPTDPTAELTAGGGLRRQIGMIDVDLGLIYFAYPGERSPSPTNGINYWEAAIRGEMPIDKSLRLVGGYAYSPDVSKTGAWSQYVAAGASYDLPAHLLPKDISVAFSGATGWSWFGHQSPTLGGFVLPAYLNWHAGVTLTHKLVNLDLRYYDSNLSKENCFVFTGDPTARPGGRIDAITNPQGLMSNWCSPTFVGKLWVALN